MMVLSSAAAQVLSIYAAKNGNRRVPPVLPPAPWLQSRQLPPPLPPAESFQRTQTITGGQHAELHARFFGAPHRLRRHVSTREAAAESVAAELLELSPLLAARLD